MWNEPTKERLARIPRLYETEQIPLRDKLIHLHFFIGGSDWYIAENDGEDMFWGFAILSNDLQNAEWGYISFSELKSISVGGIEVDCELEDYWKVRRAAEVEKIRTAYGWPRKNPPPTNGKESELIMKVKAGHFPLLLDLFAEVTNPFSDYFGMDPNLVWEKARGE